MSDQYPQHPQDPYRAGDPAQQGAYGQQPAPSAYRATPTTMSPQDERTWGAISHADAVVAMICSAGFLGFLASLAVYVIHKDRGPFVRAHAANSLNVQISMFIWLVVATVLYVILGIVTLGVGFFVLPAGLPRAAGLRGHPARHRSGEGLQRRVVGPAADAPVRQVRPGPACAGQAGRHT